MEKETVTYTYEAGKYLFRENDEADCLFIIKEGTVAIRKKKEGSQVELARIFAGEVLGELAFFDRSPRNASALAINTVVVIKVPFEGLDKLYEKVPGYIKTIIKCVAVRLKKANDTIKRLQSKVVSEEFHKEVTREDTDSTAGVLAATSGIVGKNDGKPSGGSKK